MVYPKTQKRFMTLMEMLIAMFLTIILLSAMTYFYRDIESLSSAAETNQKQNFLMRYAENRLTQVFANTIPDYNFKHHKLSTAFCFFSTGDLHGLFAPNTQSLVFMYNNNANVMSEFADACLARLFVDKQGRLCLATWPPPKEWTEDSPKMQKEVLMENVSSLSFEFYVAPEKKRDPLQSAINEREHHFQTVEPPSTGIHRWIKVWEKEYNRIPAMIKMHITQHNARSNEKYSEITFAFPLPHSKELILYEQ